MFKLSYKTNSFKINEDRYQKGDIARFYWEGDIAHIYIKNIGRSYVGHYSKFSIESGAAFASKSDLDTFISDNFFFRVGGTGEYLSATDPRILSWDWAGSRFKLGNHNCQLNAYHGESSTAAYSAWIGGGMLSSGIANGYPGNGWNGSVTFGIPTLGERIKIRGFYFSSFESSNQGIYTILRPTGSLSIDVQDIWFRMWTEKELAQSKVDALNGLSYGGYWSGVPRLSGTGTGTMLYSNYIKLGNIVMVSLTLSFSDLTVSGSNVFEVSLPVLSSYTNDAYNVVHAFKGDPVGGSFEITKTSVDTLELAMAPTSDTFILELEIKYRL